MANIEIHSQGNAKKLIRYLKGLTLKAEFYVTQVSSACVDVKTETDAPFLRILYEQDVDPIEEIIEALGPFRKEYDIEIPPPIKFLPRIND